MNIYGLKKYCCEDFSNIEGYKEALENPNVEYIEHFIKNDYQLFCEGRYTNTNKVLFFDTEEERQAMFSYLSSKLMNAFAKEVRVNQRVPWQFVPVLPDYSHPWTDKDLYNYFGLTPEEVEEIEKEV